MMMPGTGSPTRSGGRSAHSQRSPPNRSGILGHAGPGQRRQAPGPGTSSVAPGLSAVPAQHTGQFVLPLQTGGASGSISSYGSQSCVWRWSGGVSPSIPTSACTASAAGKLWAGKLPLLDAAAAHHVHRLVVLGASIGAIRPVELDDRVALSCVAGIAAVAAVAAVRLAPHEVPCHQRGQEGQPSQQQHRWQVTGS